MTAKLKKLKAFDPAGYLDDPEAISAYLEEAFDTGDAKFIADAMGVVARASGMSEIAKASGLSRESLYKALSANGNPELTTVLRVIAALGMKLSVEPQKHSD